MRSVKLREENKFDSMQNYKTVRELDDMIISTKYMKGQPKNYISDLYFENFSYTIDLPMLKDEFKTKVFSGYRYLRKQCVGLKKSR